jgi:histone-binding protein RBBP4
VSEKKNIQEEYSNWKTNVPFLYDIAITQKLDWPSLSVQWLPEVGMYNYT